MAGDATQTTVSRLLGELRRGSDDAVDRLFTLLYDALKELAHRQRRRWQDDHTLGTTALLHEAYIKLADQERIDVVSRAHFFGVASRAMRHILCNHARDRRALKRGGGGQVRLSFDDELLPDATAATPDHTVDALTALDDALRRLERTDSRAIRVVECRFFGGLSVEETAAALGISPRTVKRDWALAQAWLHRQMSSADE